METVIFLIILPLFTAFSIGMFRIFNRDFIKKWVFLSAIIHLILAIATFKKVGFEPIVYKLGSWQDLLGITLVVDRISILFVLLASFMFLLVTVYSFDYIKLHEFKYYVILKLLLAGVCGMFLTGDLFNLYVFFEIVSIASYALAAIAEYDESFEGAFKYLVMGSISGAFVLLAVILIYQSTGVLNMAEAARLFAEVPDLTKYAILALFTIGFGIKFALIPLHSWLPDVYDGAPAAFNALSSALVIKVSLYAYFRILYLLFGVEFLEAGFANTLIYLGVLTLFLAHILAYQQKNIKRLLAYSSIAQIGYLVIVFTLGSRSGIEAASFHILNDAFMKGALFLSFGVFFHKLKVETISDAKGVAYKMPVISAVFVIAALAIIGLPPFNGFVSKWLLLNAAMESGHLFVVISILLGSLLALAYYLKVIKSLYSGDKEVATESVSFRIKFPIVILGILCVLLGIFPQLQMLLVENSSEFFLNAENYIELLLGG